MENKCNKLLLIFICLITIMFSITFLIEKKVNFSEEENKYFPPFSIEEIDTYISNHFPLRTKFIILKNRFQKLIGKTFINGIYLGSENYLIPEFISNPKKDYIVKQINEFAKNKKNINVMFVPDSILINKDKLKRDFSLDEEREIKYLYDKLIYSTNIDLIEPLKNANKKYQMYYKTDHHWTTYGAYVAYLEYLKINNMEGLNLDEFEIKQITNEYLGTSASLVLGLAKPEGITLFLNNNDLDVDYVYEKKYTKSLYNYSYLNKKDKYSMFLDNNHALIKISNNSLNNNKKLLVIKNSFANNFIPFIVNNYQYTYVIDLRYFGDNVTNFYINNHIDDTLILYNLNNMYNDMSIIKLK